MTSRSADELAGTKPKLPKKSNRYIPTFMKHTSHATDKIIGPSVIAPLPPYHTFPCFILKATN